MEQILKHARETEPVLFYVDFENGHESTVLLLLSIETDMFERCTSPLYIVFDRNVTKLKLVCFIDKYVYTCTTMDIQGDFVGHVKNKTF